MILNPLEEFEEYLTGEYQFPLNTIHTIYSGEIPPTFLAFERNMRLNDYCPYVADKGNQFIETGIYGISLSLGYSAEIQPYNIRVKAYIIHQRIDNTVIETYNAGFVGTESEPSVAEYALNYCITLKIRAGEVIRVEAKTISDQGSGSFNYQLGVLPSQLVIQKIV